MKLTQRNVSKLRLPAGKTDHIEWDDDLVGFGVRLRVGSRPSYVCQYKVNGATRRIKLGLLAELDAGPARNAATAVLARVRLGEDVQATRRQERTQNAETFGAAVEVYLARREQHLGQPGNRRRTIDELKRYLRDPHSLYWRSLHKTPLAVIPRRDIAARRAIIETESGPVAARQAKSCVTAFFAWCVQEGLLDVNPTIGIKDAKHAARERVLFDDEIAAVWRACGDDDHGKVTRLLLLTGCRREELGRLQWPEIDLAAGEISLPAQRVKNGRAFTIPLSAPARDILQSIPPRAGTAWVFGRTGFTAWHQGKAALDRRIAEVRGEPLTAWRLHDLRRTAATGMAKLGIDLPTVEKCLNHQSGTFGGIVSVYQKHDFATEKRRALAMWADHVLALAEGRPRTVTPLRRA